MPRIFGKYPYINSLRRLVPDELIEAEIGSKADDFDKDIERAQAKSWEIENAAFRIISNCISPSFMHTNLSCKTDVRLIESKIGDNPSKSLLKENEIAEAVSFIVKATPQINGSNIIINAAKDLI